MAIATPGPGEILLNDVLYKLASNEKGAPGTLQVQELGTFPRKVTIGDHSLDSQNYRTTWIISDLTGGHGVSDHITDATVNRFRYSTLDTTRAKMIVPRWTVGTETGTAGAFWPLGDLVVSGNTEMYGAFGTDLHLWNETTDSWTDTTDNLAATPVNIGTAFKGTGTLKLFIPLGATGYDTYDGSTHASVAASGSIPAALDFAVLGSMLVCLDTSGQLWYSTDGSAWTSFGADGLLDPGVTGYHVLPYRDSGGYPALHLSTSHGLYVFDPAGPVMFASDAKWPGTPNAGIAAEVFRDTLFTSNEMGMQGWNSGSQTITPGVGLDRDDGLPFTYSYNCYIKDFAETNNALYALVQGDDAEDTRCSVQKMTSDGWHSVWEASTDLTVTRIYISGARGAYRVWWGGGNTAYTLEIPTGWFNPKTLQVGGATRTQDSSGWVRTGLSDFGMGGYPKIAHSVIVRIGGGNSNLGGNEPTVKYRIHEGDDFTEVEDVGTLVFPADTTIEYTDIGYSFVSGAGLAFREIELEVTLNHESHILKHIALEVAKIPRESKVWNAAIDLSYSQDNQSPETLKDNLFNLVEGQQFYPMVHIDTTYRVRVAGLNTTENAGDHDHRSIANVQLIEMKPPTVLPGS